MRQLEKFECGSDAAERRAFEMKCQKYFNFSHPSRPEPLEFVFRLGKGSTEKKRFLSGIARMIGGGLPMPEFFGPLFRSALLVNKKSLFLQECQCIELLTIF